MRKGFLIRPRALFILIISGYCVISLWARFTGWHQNDYLFFINPAREIIDGSLQIYKQRLFPEIAPPHGLGYAYPPLYAISLVPFVGLGDFLGLSTEDIGTYIFPIPLLIFDLLCLLAFLKLVRLVRSDLPQALFPFLAVIVLTCPGYLLSSMYFDHAESLLSFFLLMGCYFLFAHSLMLSSLFFSLALCTKQTALFVLLPVVFFLLRESIQNHSFKGLAIFVGILSSVFLLIQLPFIWVDFDDAYYALIEGQRLLIVSGDNLWFFIKECIGYLFPHSYQSFSAFCRNYAQWILIASTLTINIFLIFKKKISFSRSNILGVICLSAFFPVLLSKWGSSVIYKISPMLFFILWDLSRRKGDVPVLAIALILIYSLFDSLPLGIMPGPFGTSHMVMRSFCKTLLCIGIMFYIYSQLTVTGAGNSHLRPYDEFICP